MRRALASLALISLGTGSLGALSAPAVAGAQDVPGLPEALTVARCVHEQDQQIQRLVHLIEQAEQRAHAPGVAEDVRRDARASIEALVDRIRQHAHESRQCVEHTHIPVRVDEHVSETAPPDRAHESLAGDRGTVHEVEGEGALAADVRIVRGERVDGTGSAPDENVRSAVRAIGGRVSQCYSEYVDRAARRAGEIQLSFTVEGSGRATRASLESAGGFDAPLRQCLERAAREIRVPGQHGRSVYAYTLRLGD